MNINIRDKCKCISLFFSWLFHLWFPLKFLFTYSLSLMQQKKTWNNEYLLELIKRRSKVQKYISHVNVQKLQGNYSFIMTCLQIYCEQSSLKTFLQVHSISKEVSYLPWQNKSPNLKLLVISSKHFSCELDTWRTYFLQIIPDLSLPF